MLAHYFPTAKPWASAGKWTRCEGEVGGVVYNQRNVLPGLRSYTAAGPTCAHTCMQQHHCVSENIQQLIGAWQERGYFRVSQKKS